MSNLHLQGGSYTKDTEPGPSNDQNQEIEVTVLDNRFFFLKKKGRFVKVDINNIIYIKADNNYTYAITHDEKYIITSNLKKMEELLRPNQFMRVHRSFIVNLEHLMSFDLSNNKIILGQHTVPFSRSMKDQLIKRFNLIR